MSIEKNNQVDIKNLLDEIISEANEKQLDKEIITQLNTLKSSIEDKEFSNQEISEIKNSLESLKNNISKANESILKKEINELVDSLKKLEKEKREKIEEITKQVKSHLKSINPSNPQDIEKAANLGRDKSYKKVEKIAEKIASSNIPLFSTLAKKLIDEAA